ncbi:MAG TPA: Gfo/Idh/MocA family oxidoreductase [Planctomycetaceae bacterium]|nr:Gfo/Idh/MocA family oxidoreductase [Planctomycetaceae bacterium]
MFETSHRRDFLKTGAAAVLAAGASGQAAEAPSQPLRVGVIGVGNRGTHLLRLMLAHGVEVPALGDIREAHFQRAAEIVAEARQGHRPEGYTRGPTDYRRMLQRDDLDAVVVATPMQWHGVMSIDALRAGKHVLSEVAAAMTLDECWGLVRAARETGKLYMLSENCCYWDPVMTILNMVRRGVFGQLTYAECGYVHDCRRLNFAADGSLTWRGELARDYRGNLYPTHSLGPVAQWLGINRGDRLESLVAMETRQAGLAHWIRNHFPDDHPARRQRFRVADSTTVLIRTARGVLIDLRYDTISSRPHPSTVYYHLQGTRASYESRLDSIWIEGRSPSYRWEPVSKYAPEFEHPMWTEFRQQAQGSGHGGGDFMVTKAFLDAVRAGGPSPIDACDAAAWSSIIPLSAKSLAEGSTVQLIPDFTEGAWEKEGHHPQA